MTRTGNNYEKWLWGYNTITIQGRTMVLVHSTASHCKHFSWTSPGHVAFENGQALIFFRQARKNPFYKLSSYQGFTSKQTLILVSPLSFKNSYP